jgi:hypothetical protein
MGDTFDAYVLEEPTWPGGYTRRQRVRPDMLIREPAAPSFSQAPARTQAWRRLAADLPLRTLDAITSVHGFGELPDLAGQILAGQVRGRVVIEIGR